MNLTIDISEKKNYEKLSKESFLKRIYGYSTQLLPSQRHECLRAAISGEGYERVCEHIAGSIMRNFNHPKSSDAIRIWIEDLHWIGKIEKLTIRDGAELAIEIDFKKKEIDLGDKYRKWGFTK